MAPKQPYRSDGDGPSRDHGGTEQHSVWHEEWIGGDCLPGHYDDYDGAEVEE